VRDRKVDGNTADQIKHAVAIGLRAKADVPQSLPSGRC
jgi:hypothetical protein